MSRTLLAVTTGTLQARGEATKIHDDGFVATAIQATSINPPTELVLRRADLDQQQDRIAVGP
jgi:hypothetical protein